MLHMSKNNLNMIAVLSDRKSNLSTIRKRADCQQHSDTGMILAPPPWINSLAASVALLLIRLVEHVHVGLCSPPHFDSFRDKDMNDRWGCPALLPFMLLWSLHICCFRQLRSHLYDITSDMRHPQNKRTIVLITDKLWQIFSQTQHV